MAKSLMVYRVYIIEDHPVMRVIINDLLSIEPDLTICGIATSSEDALENFAEVQADLALIDTSLPGMSGIDLVRELIKQQPNLRCLMYSGHGEALYVEQALAAGALGYVVKGGDPEELSEALRYILNDTVYLSQPLRDGQQPTT